MGRRLSREGEVVMPLRVFREKYSEVAPNPRNLAAGALRQKYADAGKGSPRDLQFLAYGVEFPSDKDRHPDSPEPPEFKLDSEIISWIGEMGIQWQETTWFQVTTTPPPQNPYWQ